MTMGHNTLALRAYARLHNTLVELWIEGGQMVGADSPSALVGQLAQEEPGKRQFNQEVLVKCLGQVCSQ